METNQRRGLRGVVDSGFPLNEKQIHQGFRVAGGIEGVLARLFNIICLESTDHRGISPIQWNKLMNDYIRQVIERNTPMDRSSIRGNMNKELRRSSMTWNVFCKGLKFLKFEAFTVSVYGELSDGREFNAFTSKSFIPDSKFISAFPEEKLSQPLVKKKDGKISLKVPYTRVGHYSSVLARLFNLICMDLTNDEGFSQLDWNAALNEFNEKMSGHLAPVERVNTRSLLNKEFRQSEMTWKVFCKGLRFLRVAKFTIHIRTYREDGLVSECEASINFAPS